MTDALLKGAILSQFLKNLAEAVLQMGLRIVTLIFMFKCELRVDYFVIMLYHNKVSEVSDRLHNSQIVMRR
jgi:hypothetical protein